MMINSADSNTFNRTLFGISDPTHPTQTRMELMDGNLLCGLWFGRPNYRESLVHKSVNPFDVNYDPDSDGWYGRTSFDIPAPKVLGTTGNLHLQEMLSRTELANCLT